MINIGKGNTFSNVAIGDVAGRDIVKITSTTSSAAFVDDLQNLLVQIELIRADVSKIHDLPGECGEDVDDGLRRALQAGQKGNGARMIEKLKYAQATLLASSNSSTAHDVASVIGTLLQRAITMRI